MKQKLDSTGRMAFALAAAVLGTSVPAGVLAQEADRLEAPDELEEIIVTARKREESLQEVPASISVIGSDLIDSFNFNSLTDLAGYVPGFQVDSGGSPGQTTISLRGIAPVGPGQTVGIYLDDTPVGSSSFFARANAFSLDLLPYDIQRIEILRGPQGTLYGASTIGGLLKYVTVDPSLSESGFTAGTEFSTLADSDDYGWAVRGAADAAVIPGKLGVRASFAHQLTPGYIDNLTTGEDDQNEYVQQGGRVALLWQAADDVALRVSGIWQTVDSDNNAQAAFTLAPSQALGDGRSNVNTLPEPFEKDFLHLGATLDWNLGFADFTSATSYSDTSTLQTQDATDVFGILFPLFGAPAGVSRFDLELELEKWTQEFRLASSGDDAITWLVGAFYTNEDSRNFQVATAQTTDGASIPGLDPLATVALPSTYREYALFGDVTWQLSDTFDVSAGLRWARNDQDFTQISSGAIVPTTTTPGQSEEDVWTYSFSPRFHLTEDAMLYARVASGYRPGGPNVVVFGNPPPTVDSDSLVNYELGWKSQFLEHRALLNLAVFYMDWTDIQITVAEGGISFLDNAGSAESKGLEVTAGLQATESLRLGLSAAYVDATLTADAPSVNGQAGDRLPGIPEWSAAATAGYEFAVGGDWTGHVGGGLRYVDETLSGIESDPNSIASEAYSAVDLNADLTDGRWTFRLFARNLLDNDAALSRSVFLDGFNLPVRVVETPLQPRTVGVAVDVHF